MEEMLSAYADAVRAKDVDAFVGLYADDVRNFDLWEQWSYDGMDAMRGMVAEWFGSLAGDEQVAVTFDEVRSQAAVDEQPSDLGAPEGNRRQLEDRPRAHLGAGRGRGEGPAPPLVGYGWARRLVMR